MRAADAAVGVEAAAAAAPRVNEWAPVSLADFPCEAAASSLR